MIMLNENEKQIILNSMWVVNTALKELGLGANKDYKQLALLELHRCVKVFDASRGVKWSTYAYNSVYLKIKRRRNKDYAKQKALVNENALCYKSTEINEERANAVHTINQLKKSLTEQELFVLEQIYKGYSAREIAEQLNRSRTYVKQIWSNIKSKATHLKNN